MTDIAAHVISDPVAYQGILNRIPAGRKPKTSKIQLSISQQRPRITLTAKFSRLMAVGWHISLISPVYRKRFNSFCSGVLMITKLQQLEAIPAKNVKIENGFWAERQTTNREQTIPAIYHQLNSTGRLDAWR